MAKGLGVELRKLAQDALRAAFESHGKALISQAIKAGLAEEHEDIRRTLIEKVIVDDGATVGVCEICSAVVLAKFLAKVPMLEHTPSPYASTHDQWMFACSRCVKELKEQGGISRVITHYDKFSATLPQVKATEEEANQVVNALEEASQQVKKNEKREKS